MSKKEDVEKELEKYRPLIDHNYVNDESDDLEYDIIKFCAKKKAEKDFQFYGKLRTSFFDKKDEQLKKRKNEKF